MFGGFRNMYTIIKDGKTITFMQLVFKQVHDDQIKSNRKGKVRPRREKTPVRNM
jgi:hypothetical protein